MTKFTKTFFVGVSVALLSVCLLWAQTRIQQPTNPQTGYSAGVSYSSGGNPTTFLFNGDVNVVTDQGADLGPIVRVYDGINAAWDVIGGEFGVGEFITFEGATQDAFDTILTVEDPTVGTGTFHLPDNAAAADTYAIVFSLLDTNALAVASSIWFDTDQIIFEGTDVDTEEIILTVEDPTVGDSTYRLNDNGFADIYPVMFSNYADNSWDTTNSVWGVTNGIHFEGLTADDWENSLQSDDPTVADAVFDLPNNANAGPFNLMFSTLDTNALQVANSVWGVSNGLVFEGAGLDAFETTLTATDPTVGVQSYALPDMQQIVTAKLLHVGPSAEPAFGTEVVDNVYADTMYHPVHEKVWFRQAPPVVYTATSGGACSTTGNPNWFMTSGEMFEMDQKGDTTCNLTWAAADGIGPVTDAAANEGHEIGQGITAAAEVSFIAQTDGPFYLRVCWEIATVANTDQVYIGWRSVENYQDANMQGYADYALLGYGDLADGGPGDWYTRTLEAANVVNTDVLVANDVLDGETTCAEVRVDVAGAVTYEIDGAEPDAVVAFTLDAVTVVPMFWYLTDVTAADALIEIVYWEVGVGIGS